ncbi:MAG: ATPase, T2SS/T4P/T4SS family [Granulosicoccaceae bacterium]
MFDFYFQHSGGRRKLHKVKGSACAIGSIRSSDLVVDAKRVSKKHVELILKSDGVHLKDLGSLSGTWVNRKRVVEYGPLSELDEVTIGDVTLWLDGLPKLDKVSATIEQPIYKEANEEELSVAPEEKNTNRSGASRVLSFAARAVSRISALEESSTAINIAEPETVAEGSELPVAANAENNMAPANFGSSSTPVEPKIDEPKIDERVAYWSSIVHDQLIDQMDLRRKDVNRMTDDQLREESQELIAAIVSSLLSQIPGDLDVEKLKNNVLNESVGLGPLEQFLEDESVTEIMVNNHREIFVEKNGKITRSQYQFSSDKAVYSIIERIITPIGRRIDESSPIVDARLKDGSRVNAVIPPLALKGPSLTIRKFPKKRLEFRDLIASGSTNDQMGDFLRICVEMRKNIIVAGGTGSGKTTLLNVLSNFIPDSERIVTIEDAAEVKLVQPNLVSLESRPPNLEGKGEIPIRELVKNALRMRPDRIVVGECRGGEAIDMLQAMNTGHDGSLTTIHANNPRDVISRLEVLVLMAGMDLPVTAIREQVASAVDMIIQQTRFPCGSRKITKVTEVVGVESGTVQLQDIFEYKQEGVDENGVVQGTFRPTGFIPTFYEDLRSIGIEVNLDAFKSKAVI